MGTFLVFAAKTRNVPIFRKFARGEAV